MLVCLVLPPATVSALGLYGRRFDLSEKIHSLCACVCVFVHVCMRAITRVLPWEREEEIEMYTSYKRRNEMCSDKRIFNGAEVFSEKDRKESFLILVYVY